MVDAVAQEESSKDNQKPSGSEKSTDVSLCSVIIVLERGEGCKYKIVPL